jgi:LuxR family maltose regulon positive regulatory protein
MRKTFKAYVKNDLVFFDEYITSTNKPIKVGTKPWFTWVGNKDSFVYEGSTGHFSARSELRRGCYYWYGYRRINGKLKKVYLGRSEDLTSECLEKASAQLTFQTFENNFVDYKPVPPSQTTATNILFSTKDQNIFIPLLKIKPPAFPAKHLSRLSLIKKINSPITVICAPEGFGKTTLMNEWQQSCEMPVAWVSLDHEDNHSLHFWFLVVKALQSISPEIGQGWLSEVRSSSPSALSIIVANLTNDIVRYSESKNTSQGIGLILDDYHFIRNSKIHTSLQTWLEHMPPALKLVIGSQRQTPLSLGYMKAKGLVSEIGTDDMRLSSEEGISYLEKNTPEPLLAYSQMQELIKRTEGWITGFVFAVSILNKQSDRSIFKDTFTGSYPLIHDFFSSNLLQRQSQEEQLFLIKTSILNQLTGQLCDFITGNSDGTEMLIQLQEKNLFIEQLENPGWYRYHNFFSEVLNQHLKEKYPDEIQSLNQKAATWYTSKNMNVEAIDHWIASNSWEEAATLLEKVAINEIEQFADDSRLLNWLLQLPQEVVKQHRVLLAFYLRLAGAFFPTTDVDRFLTTTEEGTSGEYINRKNDKEEINKEIQSFKRIWSKKGSSVSENPSYGKHDNVWNQLDGILQFHLAIRSNLFEAERRASEIFESAQEKKELYGILMAGGACANLALSQGHLRRSEQIAQSVLHLSFSLSGRFPAQTSISLTALSSVSFKRNQLMQAHQLLNRATEVNPEPSSTIVPVSIAILRAKIQSAQGDNEAAFATIQAARELHNKHPSSIWVDQDLIAYLRLFRYRQGILRPEDRALIDRGELELSAFSILVSAEILLEEKRCLAAEDLLTHLLEKYPYGVYMLPVLRAKVILAIALFEQHKLKDARKIFIESARLASTEFYIRPFIDYGPKLESLISFVLHSENLPGGIQAFLKGILIMLGKPNGIQRIIPSAATEKLALAASISSREQEILKLLSTGLSNREIAFRCGISTSTVKTHIENIYEKLGVNSRLLAIAQAQLLNLI